MDNTFFYLINNNHLYGIVFRDFPVDAITPFAAWAESYSLFNLSFQVAKDFLIWNVQMMVSTISSSVAT